MPRRTGGRTIGAEDAMLVNIARLLDEQDRSIAWLQRKVCDSGYPLPNQAIWKALNAGRAIYVDEAIAIASVLGVSLDQLIVTP